MAVAGGLALAGLLSWWWVGGTPPEALSVPRAEVEALPLPEPPPPEPAPVPDMSELVLRGVLLRPGAAAAIIGEADGRQRLVRVGALVAPGVRLAEVTSRSAVLDIGGVRQVLLLDLGVAAPEAAEAVRGRAALLGSANDWRLAVRAVREDGRISGWEVRDSAVVPLLGEAGLRPGDVLLAVNDIELFSEEKLMDVPAELAGAGEARLHFRRGEKDEQARVRLGD
jgi:hypothetical protein